MGLDSFTEKLYNNRKNCSITFVLKTSMNGYYNSTVNTSSTCSNKRSVEFRIN